MSRIKRDSIGYLVVIGFCLLMLTWGIPNYTPEYPGYGARPGPTSEQAIKSAAERALKQLLAQDSRPLYLLGESLGSGVASQ